MKFLIGLMASMRTAIVLIAILTVLAITGTLIPQRLEAINYIQGFPKSWQFVLGMGFDDIYRSKLFLGVLTLLCISTITCIVIRWKSTSKKLFSRLKTASLAEIKSFKVSDVIATPSERAMNGFEKTTKEDGTQIALKSSGKSALLGGMILHIGLVLIFIGGLLGLLYGVEMSMSGKTGEKVPVPNLEVIRAAVKADNMSREARHIRQFSPNNPVLDDMRAEIERLHKIYHDGVMNPDFKVSFDKLWVEYYEDGDGNKNRVKSWNAQIKFMELEPGNISDVIEESEAITLKVNHPVSYKDYGFYLASWDKNWKSIKLKVDYAPEAKNWEHYKPQEGIFPKEIEVGIGEPFEIQGFPHHLIVRSFLPDFKVGKDGIYNVSQEANNPAAMILAFDKDSNSELGHAWAFLEDKSMMSSHVSNLPLKFIFEKADYEYQSILQMSYDPGKPVVWLGCLLFCIGMILTFYVSYREEWVVFNPDGTALIAFNSNNAVILQKKEFEIFKQKMITSNHKENQ